MRTTAVTLALVLAAGCSKDPPKADPAPANSAASVTTGSASASTAAPVKKAPAAPFVAASVPEIKAPAGSACTFKAVSLASHVLLRIDPVGAPFLRITAGALTASVPTGSGDAVVQVERAGFELRGLVHGDTPAPKGLEAQWRQQALPLHPTKAFFVGGVLLVTPKTVITYASTTPGRLVPSLVGGFVTSKAPFEAHACDDFSLDVAKFDARAAIPKGGSGAKKLLRKGAGVPISATATGAATAELSPAAGGAEIKVIEEASGHARIVLEGEKGIVVAWVDAKDLRESKEDDLSGAGPDLGGVGPGGSGIGKPSLVDYECPDDVKLYADVSDAAGAGPPYAAVGTIHKGTPFTVLAGGELAHLYGMKLPGMSPAPEAALAVARADLAKCTRK